MISARDEKYLRQALDLAVKARELGNQPFGALVVGADDEVLGEGMNTEVQTRDVTGHAETNAMKEAVLKYDADVLAQATLYTSTEPCPMCAAAIYWGGVGRVVFALSGDQLYDEIGAMRGIQLRLSSREIYERGERQVEVHGPLLREEAFAVQDGYWS